MARSTDIVVIKMSQQMESFYNPTYTEAEEIQLLLCWLLFYFDNINDCHCFWNCSNQLLGPVSTDNMWKNNATIAQSSNHSYR